MAGGYEPRGVGGVNKRWPITRGRERHFDNTIIMETTLQVELQGESPLGSGDCSVSLVLSAHVGQNAKVFEQLMNLHVPHGSIVADVTYGKGCFWNTIPEGRYNVKATDIKDGVDCRNLPYAAEEMDCVVLDPPYMEGFYRRHKDHLAGTGSHANIRNYYGNHAATGVTAKWHGAVREMYLESAKEAHRVLRPKGAFVVVRTNRPTCSKIHKQAHARKNHSYFLVFEKRQ